MSTRILTTRRRALVTTAAAVAGGALAMAAPRHALAATPYKRRSIDDLSDAELKAYTKAVKILMDRSIGEPDRTDGYTWQARLHNDPDRLKGDGSRGRCDHNSERFLPWHRVHLVGFEMALRGTDPSGSIDGVSTASVSIPYWDWTKSPTGLRLPKRFEDPSSPLFKGSNDRNDGDPPVQWSASAIVDFVKEPDWNEFGGRAKTSSSSSSTGPLESGPHGSIHDAIGPTMADGTAASNDPIYWSFHAYIDLVWSRWQRLHTTSARPQKFMDPNATLYLEPLVATVAQTATTLDVLGMSYEYEYDFAGADGPPPPSPPAAAIAARGRPAAVVNSAGRELTVRPEKELPAASRPQLIVRDIVARGDTNYRIDIYLHPASLKFESLPNNERAKHLVRSLTILKGGHHSDPFDAYVDLSKAVSTIGGAPWHVTAVATPLPIARRGAEPRVLSSRAFGSTREVFKSLEIGER